VVSSFNVPKTKSNKNIDSKLGSIYRNQCISPYVDEILVFITGSSAGSAGKSAEPWRMRRVYPLVMTVTGCELEAMAHDEIVDLPIFIAWWIFPVRKL